MFIDIKFRIIYGGGKRVFEAMFLEDLLQFLLTFINHRSLKTKVKLLGVRKLFNLFNILTTNQSQ